MPGLRRFRLSLRRFSIVLVCWALVQAEAAGSPGVSGHPRLFANREELARSQLRFAQDPNSFDLYLPPLDGSGAELKPLSDGISPQRSLILLARYALCLRLTGEHRYQEALLGWVPLMEAYEPPTMKSIGGHEGLTAGHILLGAAMGYDFLADRGDERLSRAFRDLLLKQARATYRDLAALRSYPYEQNHLIIPTCGLAVAALAVLDEEPEATVWLAFSQDILSRSLAALGNDGWFFEGVSYWNYTLQFPICYALALKRVTGQDVLGTPIFANAIPYLAHIMLPGGDKAFDFSDWGPRVEIDGKSYQSGYDAPWHSLPTRPKLFIPIALKRENGGSAFSDDLVAYLASRNRRKSGTNAIDALFMMLWSEIDRGGPVAMGAYGDSPAYRFFSDHGVLHWRENWSDPDAVAFAFKAGPPAGHSFAKLIEGQALWRPSLGHAHPDAGSFILFAGGAFLAGDTGYTGKKETADHNSLLVDGVGQHKGGTPWSTFEGKPYGEYDKIDVTDFWLSPLSAAATADLTAAYSDGLKLKRVERTVLLVAGKYLVVSDRLSSSASHVYEWRWHSDRAAALEGDLAVVEEGRVRLILKNVLPVDSMTVAPTVVETELYSAGRSRPQQRGFHLSVKSSPGLDREFVTAAVIQRGSRMPAEASRVSDAVVRFVSGEESCLLWHRSGDGLVGSYAFACAGNDGKVASAGFKGLSFTVGGVTIVSEVPVSLLLRFCGGSLELESQDGPASEVLIRHGTRETKTMLVRGTKRIPLD